MYKIYDLDYELFDTFTEEEKQDFLIKSNHNIMKQLQMVLNKFKFI